MALLRCAVIGVGYLGKFHAQKYAKIPECQLVAVVDSRQEQAEAVAGPLGCAALTDYRALIGQVDAVSIVVPTQGHYEVCAEFLRAGVHVLVEKPMTPTLEQADALIRLAKEDATRWNQAYDDARKAWKKQQKKQRREQWRTTMIKFYIDHHEAQQQAV